MIVAILTFLLQAAASAPQASTPKEIWEPWMTWACLVREDGRDNYFINGVIARRNEPDHPVAAKRHERALRVLRDDSGAFAGRQARWPMFVVHPKQYWAFFSEGEGPAFGPSTRSIVFNKDGNGRPTKIELFARSEPQTKAYASGECVGREIGKDMAS